MCGIVGAYSVARVLPSVDQVRRALDRLRRRGPDDGGGWSDPEVILGHRRLAVVDLSAAGHQPMESTDGRYVVVFNGEIYNHREVRSQLMPPGGWRGTSDTETLLESYRSWGLECLSRFNGMFAFALWDRSIRRLFVARDRLGVKPLYFRWHNRTFLFASRPSALAALTGEARPAIDVDALRAFLDLGHVPAPMAIYSGMQKLRQAHYLTVDEQGLRIVRYWDYRSIVPDESLLRRTEDSLVDELDQLMRSAVRLRLLSDVPLGAFLSGGSDSGLVVATMKSVGISEPNAFTIAFDDKAFDEGPAAAAIARHVGVNHVIETMNVHDLLALLPKFIQEYDEPFADSSAFPTMAVSRLARRHVTVALTGDGGDELFGGYHYYSLVDKLTSIGRLPWPTVSLLKWVAAMLPMHRARLLSGALNHGDPVALFHYLRSYSKDFGSFLSEDLRASTISPVDLYMEAASAFPLVLTSAEIGMRLDTQFTLADGYLQKVDVATMAFSLEARSPFLDFRVVEWAMRLPYHYKIRGRETKYLLKRLLSRYLPERMVFQPKRGFSMPVASWLRGPLKSWAAELLHDEALAAQLSLDRRRVIGLFNSHISGARDAHPMLWALLMSLSFVAHHVNGQELPTIATTGSA